MVSDETKRSADKTNAEDLNEVSDDGQVGSNLQAAETSNTAESDSSSRPTRTRRTRQFPPSTFEEALIIGQGIQQYGGGRRIRRLILFDNLGRKASSRLSRQLITSSTQYGITKGHAHAEYLELTPKGAIATSDDSDPSSRLQAQFDLAIVNIGPFNELYQRFKDGRLPAPAVLRDAALEASVAEDNVQECIETFVVNAKYLGLLRTLAGAERLVGLDYALEQLAQAQPPTANIDEALQPEIVETTVASRLPERQLRVVATEPALDHVCFYIAPIGPEGSEWRKHSDLFMGTLIEPALKEFNLNLVRADAISKPGIINAQVIEHIVRCPLVIADLSFHNPNVFYELALRHAMRKPIVQIIRAADPIPFDLQAFRTITIDTTDIYSLVPQIETYKSQIASQIRTTLNDTDQAENPLSLFFPAFWSSLPPLPSD